MTKKFGRIVFFIFASLGIIQGTSAEEIKKTKRIDIYLLSQILICQEDGKEVYRTRVSTGRGWHSKKRKEYRDCYPVIRKDPRGAKARCIVKGKHGYNSPTPWKILLCNAKGHLVRLHEYHSVPRRPASNGCIRVPRGMGKWIYQWVDLGTPVYTHLEEAPHPKPKLKPKKPSAPPSGGVLI